MIKESNKTKQHNIKGYYKSLFNQGRCKYCSQVAINTCTGVGTVLKHNIVEKMQGKVIDRTFSFAYRLYFVFILYKPSLRLRLL